MMSGNQDLRQSILGRDDKKIKALYHACFPHIKNMILSNSGRLEDAEDIFHESLIVLYRKLKQNKFELKCSLDTYIYSICRNMWMDKLRRTGKFTGVIDTDLEIVDLDEDIIETINQNDRNALFQKHFQSISENCQKLLTLFIERKNMNQITAAMGFGSELYARKRKFQCKEKLVESIQKDPLYKELKRTETKKDKTSV